ncbi:MAG TPA: AEC family transporter [Bacillota bacterium]|nr:AEC family transporter [Bacillota bacterium]
MGFLEVFEPISVLFMILMAGFLARRLAVFDDAVVKGLASLLLKVTLPALIIDSLQRTYSPDLMRDSGNILLMAIPIYLISALVALLCAALPGIGRDNAGVVRFAVMFPNTGFMGYPVILSILGPEALFLAVIYNLPFNLMAFTVGIMFITMGRGDKRRFDYKVLLSPAVLSVIIGFLFFVSSVRLPGPLAESLKLIGSVTTPLAMITVGATLSGMKLNDVFGNWRVYFVSAMRLFVMPLLVFFVLNRLGLDPLLLSVLVVLNAMPVAINGVLFAAEYDANPAFAAQAVFVSTMLSAFTIPLVAMLVR